MFFKVKYIIKCTSKCTFILSTYISMNCTYIPRTQWQKQAILINYMYRNKSLEEERYPYYNFCSYKYMILHSLHIMPRSNSNTQIIDASKIFELNTLFICFFKIDWIEYIMILISLCSVLQTFLYRKVSNHVQLV